MDQRTPDEPAEADGSVAVAPEDEAGAGRRRTGDGAAGDGDRPARPVEELDWWHRDHPTFTALTGFFSGLAYVAVVPALFAGLLTALFDERTAHEAFPFVLLILVLPTGLLVVPRTTRFGKYMLVGMVVTFLVVTGVAWAVTWLLVRNGL